MSVGSLSRLQSVFPSGSGSDYENSPREDDCCLQPLDLTGSTDDDVECGSCISATTSYSRLSIRDMSDLALVADLSGSEFADSTPIDSDRSERQPNLKSFLERSNTGTAGAINLSRFSPIRCDSSSSTSPPNSPPPTCAPRLPSTLLYTKSLRPHRIKTTLPFSRRQKPLKLIVSISFKKLSDSQISKYEVSPVKCSTDRTIKEPTKKICRQKNQKQNRSRTERKRSFSPSLSDVVITVPAVESLVYEDNISKQEVDVTICSNLSWETANSDVMFSTPISSVCSSVTEPQQQPYVVTVECSSTDEFPSKRINRGTNGIDKIVENCTKNCSLDTVSLFSANLDQSTSSGSLMDTVESLHSHNQSTVHVTSSFSFEGVFSFYPPDLTVVDGELAPAHTLSLKDSTTVPFDHPVHKWSFGKRVVNGQRKRKRCPQKIIR